MSSRHASPPVGWPEDARFAFTVFDDTDHSTLVTAPPVYAALTDLGFRVTKSVWPVASAGPLLVGDTTCADPAYLDWVLGLRAAGHEIGYHNASNHSSTRTETIAALDAFRTMFGHDPRIGADHAGNREAMYWGPRRLTGWRAAAYRRASDLVRPGRGQFQGHVATSEYFWGDVLRDRIDYWRNFTFTDLNVLRSAPAVPYHDPARPYVNWWFAAAHAPTLGPFLDLFDPERLDRRRRRVHRLHPLRRRLRTKRAPRPSLRAGHGGSGRSKGLVRAGVCGAGPRARPQKWRRSAR